MDNKKRTFIQGMIAGVLIMVVLGGVFMLGRGYGANGSLSYGGNTNANNAAPTGNQPQAPTAPEGDVTKIAPVTDADHIRGDKNAKITMIEYSDFQCPYCGQFSPTMEQALEAYKGKVRLVYRHFPLRSIHPLAEKAAQASECASDQGKFWEMHDKLFGLNVSQSLSLDTINKSAVDLKLNMSKFTACLDGGEKAAIVEQQLQDGMNGGVQGTPGTFIGSQYVPGALPYDSIKAIIEQQL